MEGLKVKWKAFTERVLRYPRRVSDFFLIAAVLSVLVTIAGTLLSGVVFRLLFLRELFELIADGDDNMYAFLVQYADFIGIWVFVLLIVFLLKHNRPMWKMLAPGRKTLGHIGAGILLGFGTNAFCVLMSLLLGDIKLTFNRIEIVPIIAFIIVVFIQSGAEELVDRMYLYSKLRRRYRCPLVAILLNSAVFMGMHALNDGFTFVAALQLVVVALVFSELVYWYNGLWIAMAFHAAWNFSQSIFFGLPNSGIISAYSVFRLDAASATDGFFYNVGFGVEGSVGAVLVISAVGVVIWLLNRNKPEKLDIWEPYDVAPAVVQTDVPADDAGQDSV
jgi:hypothetical protein